MKKKAEIESLKCDHEPVLHQLESVLKSKPNFQNSYFLFSKGQRVLESLIALASIARLEGERGLGLYC